MAIKTKFCGLKEKLIYYSISKLRDVKGRLELVKKYPNGIKVFIDYAHTPDALLQTLKYLKSKYGNNISLVFGCGGERDKNKRSKMARIADENCKNIYITDDNPRNEDPKKIRKILFKYIKNNAHDIGSRVAAIKKAIQNAGPQEIVLIAGKGHEEQQIYKNKIINISDKQIIKQVNLNHKKLNIKELDFNQNKSILRKIINKKNSQILKVFRLIQEQLKKIIYFLALKGNNFDGSQFINNALKKGAGCVITSSKIKRNNKKILKFKDPINFLNSFGRLKREHSLAKRYCCNWKRRQNFF